MGALPGFILALGLRVLLMNQRLGFMVSFLEALSLHNPKPLTLKQNTPEALSP